MLENVVFEGEITAIPDYAFYGCSGLTELNIPGNIETIGNYAFAECEQLTSATISGNATSIGNSAFRYCSNLQEISLPFIGSEKTYADYTHFGYIFGASSYSSNSSYVPSSLKKVTIEGAETIPSDAFYDCYYIKEIIIGDGVTSIGSSAFEYCNSLTNVEIPSSVMTIGSGAFEYCYSMEEITLPFVGSAKTNASYTHFGYIFGASSSSSNTP